MSKSKARSPRLGRGLSSLMAQPVPVDLAPLMQAREPVAGAPAIALEQATPGVAMLPLGAISAGAHQPRQHFDPAALDALARSIREDGVLQPIIVRPTPAPGSAPGSPGAPSGPALADGRYELIAGERRWRAAELAGLTHVPAIVRDVDDRQAVAWALIENLQRQDLNAIERALGFQDLAQRFALSHDEVAARVGVERSTVSNSLRLLGLCEEVRSLVQDGHLSGGQAKALAGVIQPAQQVLLAKRCVAQNWSVRQLEMAVRRVLAESAVGGAADGEAAPGRSGRSAHVADLEQQIAGQLGTKVRIRPGRKKGTGALAIQFGSLDEFDRLLERLGVETT